MIFDATINLGQLITLGGWLAGGLLAVGAMRNEIRNVANDVHRLDERMDGVDTELRKQTEILVQLGRVDERINALGRQGEDMALTIKGLMAEIAVFRHGSSNGRL